MNRALRFTLLVLAVVLVISASACGSSVSDTLELASTVRCRGAAKPVSVQDAARALHEAGFSVASLDRSEFQCRPSESRPSSQDLLAVLSNDHAGSYDEIQAREGHVLCDIFRGPIYRRTLRRDLHEVPASPIYSGRKAGWWFANVSCDIHIDDEQHADVKVAKLDKAMRRLASTVIS